ncbi:penicillin-binding transpeptidase domain-containing protein [Actinomadura hibisca]|uniref:penicillin-binding transpeptidase domain-containing protein n=1 Tax=Actinomadura hibisca TaxID=68565 RepID=UPI001FE21FB6|nr:penicillin-binding transpeptidase domain-containing protein [Actinomadura hibisca]
MSKRARGRAHARTTRRRPVRAPLRRVVAMATGAALVAGTATGCFAEPSAMPTVRDFLIAWQVGNYKAASKLTTGADQTAVERTLGQVRTQLDAVSMKLALGVPVQPGSNRKTGVAIVKKGDSADARFSVKFDLGENGKPWTYTGLMRLKRIGGHWKVVWDPSIIHPRLKEGQRLAVVTETPNRETIRDSKDRSLLSPVAATVVGVTPGRLADPKRTLDQLAKATRLDGNRRLDVTRLLGRVRSAPPQQFLPLLTLQRPTHNALIMQLRGIAGVEVTTRALPIGAAQAPEVVGTLGPATADKLQTVGAPYQPGDTIGTEGLQLHQQRRLAGTPTVRVVAQDAAGKDVQELISWPGETPQPVRTFLSRDLQKRADQALAGVPYPASMVAVRSAQGEVWAAANHNTGGKNLALEGHYPPGATFAIIAAGPLMNAGVTLNTKVPCPARVDVGGGGAIVNPAGARPAAPFQNHLAQSCATLLASLAGKVDNGTLMSAVARFGFGKNLNLSVPSFSGTVPAPANDGEKAALLAGQGKVRVSPLSMALVAGATEVGNWRPPQLLQNPRNTELAPSQALDSTTSGDLERMLRLSTRQGAARSAGARSAELGMVATVTYPENGQNKTVSWFVGSNGGYGFAIAVEGKADMARIVGDFLSGTSSAPAGTTPPAR